MVNYMQFVMARKIYILFLFLFLFFIDVNGNNGSGLEYRAGIRFLYLQPLNDALKQEGLAELNPNAFSVSMGKTVFNEKFVFNYRLHSFAAHGKENINRSHFWGFGISLDFGFPVWKNNKMCLYPYFNPSFNANQFRTFQKTDANSISSVYAQPLVERTFTGGDISAALGLSYQIIIAKKYLLKVGGGYHFRLWQPSDWRHLSGSKIDFPKVDNRGWEIGVSWLIFRKSVKKEE